jgi:hypothetical protein
MKERDQKDLLVMGPSQEGGSIPYLRSQQGHLESGELRLVKEGTPIGGNEEVAHLTANQDGTWDVKTLYARKEGGPTMVNSPAFHEGWDRIFSGAKKVTGLN